MDAEKKQQLYGGEISDYLNNTSYKTFTEDNDSIAKVYDFYVKRRKTLSDLLGFNPGEDFYDKLK